MNDRISFEKLVHQYLEFLLAEDFNLLYDLKGQLFFTENLLTKKLVVVENFSPEILDKKGVKSYLINIISNINLRIIDTEDMWRTLNSK